MLSPVQQQILDLAKEGHDLNGIAKNLRTEAHLVSANITRIKNKGEWPATLVLGQGTRPTTSAASFGIQPDERPAVHPEMAAAEGYRPKVHAKELTSDQLRAIQDRIERAGEVPAELLEAVNRGANDVNPLLIMGTTIQFVKLCGGRIAAHQVIEDVYDSLRAFADGVGIRNVG